MFLGSQSEHGSLGEASFLYDLGHGLRRGGRQQIEDGGEGKEAISDVATRLDLISVRTPGCYHRYLPGGGLGEGGGVQPLMDSGGFLFAAH